MINVGEVLGAAVNSIKAEKVYLIEKNIYKDKLIDHLKRLNENDRYMRFGTPIIDSRIEHYVNDQIKSGDFVFAVFNESGDVVAMLHMAKDNRDKDGFELGFSVDAEFRHCGFASELFKKGISFAKTLGAKRIYTYCLSENKAMQHLAKKHDLKVMLEYGDVTGELELKEKNFGESINNLIDFATDEQMMILDTMSQGIVKNYLDQFEYFKRIFGSFNPLLRSFNPN